MLIYYAKLTGSSLDKLVGELEPEYKSTALDNELFEKISTLTDEQKKILKEYALEMGGTYTSIKVVDTLPDGTVEESFPAQIEFSKDSAYSAEICAKMLLGENTEDILKELMERKAIQEERQKAIEEREKGKTGNK